MLAKCITELTEEPGLDGRYASVSTPEELKLAVQRKEVIVLLTESL